jgi:hypothetical protein
MSDTHLKRDKISDKIAQSVAAKKPFFSFEYFVPKTPEGILNLYGRIQRMGEKSVLQFFFFFFSFLAVLFRRARSFVYRRHVGRW